MEEDCRAVVQHNWGVMGDVNIKGRIEACGKDLETWGTEQRKLFRKEITLYRNRVQALKFCVDENSIKQV